MMMVPRAYRIRNLLIVLAALGVLYIVCVNNSTSKFIAVDKDGLSTNSPTLIVRSSPVIDVKRLSAVRKRQVINSTLNSLPAGDYSTLINLTDFKFVINNDRCRTNKLKSASDKLDNHVVTTTNKYDIHAGRDVYLIVFVHSSPSHFDRRQVIRSTWGNESLFEGFATKLRVVFMLGTVQNVTIEEAIIAEDAVYHDIVQGSFEDTYRNLTYKHVMGLKWVSYFCSDAQYVLKTDDDIFIDVFQLMFYLRSKQRWPTNNFMACYVITNPYPKRSPLSKWRVTLEEYPQRYYPHYCSGWGILMSPDVAIKLYSVSTSLPYFWVDDVHVSGLLAQKIGIQHTDFNLKLAYDEQEIEEFLSKDTIVLPPLFGLPDSSSDDITKMWRKTIEYYRLKYPSRSFANY